MNLRLSWHTLTNMIKQNRNMYTSTEARRSQANSLTLLTSPTWPLLGLDHWLQAGM
jgi:hypothetical protein